VNRRIAILDCTLRDGSYSLDFQFTARDTALLCAGLEKAGLELIEIGHGFGLGASGPKLGVAAATDEEYLQAAASSLKKARFGAFFIPGIGTIEHLDLARRYGMSFVRIGTNITQSEEAEPFIRHAKRIGLEVSYNGMKSYVVGPDEFLQRVRKIVAWGADSVNLVDSAGGMLPAEVMRYIRLLRDNLSCPLGFHGHNNLMLAIANNLAAIEAGAASVDTTLGGIGRSAGNAQTEVMVLVCEKLGMETGIDPYQAMDLGERLIRPRMQGVFGISAMDLTLAHALCHSSFLPRIQQAAEEFGVDARALVVEISKRDKVNPSPALIREIAAALAAGATTASSRPIACSGKTER
jgi:4-hydroxy-2-oxovalerate aldolase